jgi:general stress protein 26
VEKALARQHFCTLATAAPDGLPHSVAIQYAYVDGHLYFVTGGPSKKARNIRSNPHVAVTIPVRKYPFGPPFSVQFRGTAEILWPDDPEIVRLIDNGKLKAITGLGVLKEPGICFLRVKPARRIHTYGLGIPLRELLRAPSQGDRTVLFDELHSMKGGLN